MNEELAKCPACDSTMMWPQPGNEEAICSNTDCGYQVNVWDHHVLARRAEVGRLVETVLNGVDPDTGSIRKVSEKILAADAEWREANAPTFVALREKYPDHNFWLMPHNCANDCVMTELEGEQRSHASRGHALEWLAAKLAEGGSDDNG